MNKPKKLTKVNVSTEIDHLIEQAQYNEALELIGRFKVSGYTVTQTTIKKEYGLSPAQMETLAYREVKNPHYSKASPMRLFIIKQVEQVKANSLSALTLN